MLFFTVNTVLANNGFKMGDKVYVWSLHGIPLKQKPDVRSKSILIIPYGKQLQLQDITTAKQEVLFSNDVESLYELEGEWVRVAYNGKAGFVFDGFLSVMPPLKLNKKGLVEDIEKYLYRNFGKPEVSTKKTITTSAYKNGNKLEIDKSDCIEEKLYLKGISYPEAMLFEKIYYTGADAAQNIKIKKKWGHTIVISSYSCD